MGRAGKWRFVCMKVLPLVYDESLSYYEFLCKLAKTIEETEEKVNELGERVEELGEIVEEFPGEIERLEGEIETIGTELEGKVGVSDLEQTTGQSTDKVMSQKAVTDAISGGGVEVVQTTGQSTTAVMSQKATTDAVNGVRITVVQTTGQNTGNVMSQKAVTDAINAHSGLPEIQSGDGGKFLRVKEDESGAEWSAVISARGVSF